MAPNTHKSIIKIEIHPQREKLWEERGEKCGKIEEKRCLAGSGGEPEAKRRLHIMQVLSLKLIGPCGSVG
jgi:hypothetical protein